MYFQKLLQNCRLLKPNIDIIRLSGPQNPMSMWPKYYIEPIFRNEDQEELKKSGEISQYVHLPTRAALNHHTCSLHYDPEISLFTNYLMRCGDKVLARTLIDKTFEEIKRLQIQRYHKAKTEEDKATVQLDPREIFHQAVENCKPLLQLRAIKRGGVKYQVPVPITNKTARFMSMNWLIASGSEKDRKKVRYWTQLAKELIDAANNTGRVVRKKQELHQQCEANKAYAHYRWS